MRQRRIEHRVGRRPDGVGGIRVHAAHVARGHAGGPAGLERIVEPEVGEAARRVGRHIAVARDRDPADRLGEIVVLRVYERDVALQGKLGCQLQAAGQFDTARGLRAHGQADAWIVGVGGGHVLALDFVDGHGGRSPAIPEVELAAHFGLPAGGELVIVQHVGEGGGGQQARRRVRGGRVLRVQRGFRTQLPIDAQPPGQGRVAALGAGGRGRRDGAAVGQVHVDEVLAQRRHDGDARQHLAAVFQGQRQRADAVVAVGGVAARHAGDVVEVAGREIVGIHRVHLGGQAGGIARDLVLADVDAEGPVAGQAGQGGPVQAFHPVADQALLMAL
ncbi:hypothetical protein FQZ97_699920 [compost metagenome]